MRLFRRHPQIEIVAPFWVVADLDRAIRLAAKTLWPEVIVFGCEEHLRERMRLALVEDGIPRLSVV
jgi:hypothetical protein